MKVAFLLCALALVSMNLRPAITTLAGVMGQLHGTFGVDAQALPLLGAAPVLAFGLSAPIGPWLARRTGTATAIAVALTVLAVALLTRALVPGFLFPGTLVAGAAIMTASVLVPQIVKANRGTGWWTGLCTMGFGLGAALGAGLVQPLQEALGSLEMALAIWAVPAVLAAVMIKAATRKAAAHQVAPGTSTPATVFADVTVPLRRQGTAWAITAFFGLQAMLYFAVTSWLAVFLESKGFATGEAAALLAWFSIAGLPGSLLTPVLASRPRILRILAPGLGILVAAALLAVLVAPQGLQFTLIGVLGIIQSAPFGLGMALIVIRSAGPRTAGRLSAMTQGLGFSLAAAGPLLAGLLHTWTGGWTAPFWCMAGVGILLAVAGFAAVNGAQVTVGEEAAELPAQPAAVGP
ncbi:MFS transporter [Pseudarthrobacter sp. J75]|uniref:MFS transporter n=1 Tax=unclassified Pseudarthrobacter TaxID=2647000 RepID=UPI002E80D6E1|nr:MULTISPECIES: MFS transporter [unclassified Pseudarthrobacter]MEE2523160.1 MFS transporter [Pseudarthrobacter sp. J47]MEE2527415.1 MFS transporter [Pseudarthrobacter sp. J75]